MKTITISVRYATTIERKAGQGHYYAFVEGYPSGALSTNSEGAIFKLVNQILISEKTSDLHFIFKKIERKKTVHYPLITVAAFSSEKADAWECACGAIINKMGGWQYQRLKHQNWSENMDTVNCIRCIKALKVAKISTEDRQAAVDLLGV